MGTGVAEVLEVRQNRVEMEVGELAEISLALCLQP